MQYLPHLFFNFRCHLICLGFQFHINFNILSHDRPITDGDGGEQWYKFLDKFINSDINENKSGLRLNCQKTCRNGIIESKNCRICWNS